MISTLVRLSVLVLALCTVLSAADGSITGTVRDSEGAAIAKAHIVVRADGSGKRAAKQSADLMTETDKQGHFSASVTAVGFYDVCVMADAFSPYCEKVFVNDSSLALKVQLKADPEVMKRLGDAF